MDYSYISVYSSDETDFSHNGLRVLCPTSCAVTEVLNGEYSLTLSHPLDPWDNWKYIVENNIVKSRGQLFRIYKKTLSMTSDGSYEIKADAMHISYDLNFYFIKDSRPMLKLPDAALEWIVTPAHDGYQNILNGDPGERFSFFTDLDSDPYNAENYRTAYYEKMSVTKALIGADNCFLNVWGGELVRDNFDVKILKRRGNENSFSIRYGVDMTEIQAETDLSGYCSSLYYEATIYHEYTENGKKIRNESGISGIIENENADDKLPVKPMGFYAFEVNLKDIKSETDLPGIYEIKADCERRAREYLYGECQPLINFHITFADLKNYDLYKDFHGLQECGLGDTGTVFHELLGIETTRQIVKKTIDGITGEVLSVELGNLRKSLTGELARGK
ncbi:MAG: phage tail protein [Clostridium sp.]|nr:phage tail protein [Clostridium sp.]MCM1547914.1 phage tail protein [Ruminococcus sp.]